MTSIFFWCHRGVISRRVILEYPIHVFSFGRCLKSQFSVVLHLNIEHRGERGERDRPEATTVSILDIYDAAEPGPGTMGRDETENALQRAQNDRTASCPCPPS